MVTECNKECLNVFKIIYYFLTLLKPVMFKQNYESLELLGILLIYNNVE